VVREHLITAGVDRSELHTLTRDTLRVDLRSMRTTGITWDQLCGTDAKTLERRAGHASGTSTDRYIRVAEDVGLGAIGEPFGPLPAALVSATFSATETERATISRENKGRGGGIRTPDYKHPKLVRYQTALRPDNAWR
jgi:hypothetical protein